MKLIVTVKFTRKGIFRLEEDSLTMREEYGLPTNSPVHPSGMEETRADYIFRESIEGVVSRFFSPHG